MGAPGFLVLRVSVRPLIVLVAFAPLVYACFEEEEPTNSDDTNPDAKPGDRDGDGTPDAEDCAPDDPEIHLDADEICFDSIDNNCDGSFTIGCWIRGGTIEASLTHARLIGEDEGGRAGASVALGDVNGSGRLDIIFGAPGPSWGCGSSDAETPGVAYVHQGPAYGDTHMPFDALKLVGEEDGDCFGTGVTWTAASNGPGPGRVVVGAPYHRFGDGAVYVVEQPYLGNRQIGAPANLGIPYGKWIGADNDRIGSHLAGGDFAGGEVGDLAIGAPIGTYLETNDGVYLIEDPEIGARTELSESSPSLVYPDPDEYPDYTWPPAPGPFVANGGRRPGGVRDLLLMSDVNGYAYLLEGPNVDSKDFSLSSERFLSGGGQFVGAGGDVTGDGVPDVLLAGWTCWMEGDEEVCDDAVRVLSTNAEYTTASAFFDEDADASPALLSEALITVGEDGYDPFVDTPTIAGAGDINGDGQGDLIVGDPEYDDYRGAVHIVLGPIEGRLRLPEDAFLTVVSDSSSHEFGTAVAGGGDINGDRFDDVIWGAPGAEDERGVVYVIYGGRTLVR